MSVTRRSILGPANSLDNHLQPASAVSGGSNALDRGPGYTQPLSVQTGDQQSAQTASERANLEDSFRSAQAAACRISSSDAGAGGAVVAASSDEVG